MEAYSRKPKEWVRITNEHNHRLTATHVCVLLFKGLACLSCLFYLALVSFCLTSPYLAPTPLCFALPYLAYPTLGHA